MGLLGYHNIMQVQCSTEDSVNLGREEFGQFSKFKGGGGIFRIQGVRIYGGLANLQDLEWDGLCWTFTFSGGSDPPRTL